MLLLGLSPLWMCMAMSASGMYGHCCVLELCTEAGRCVERLPCPLTFVCNVEGAL